MNITEPSALYGKDDATYIAAGEEAGIRVLVNHFYDLMDTEPSAKPLRLLHAGDLTESREKLTAFLSGWMGGPKLYQQRYGQISIPGAHSHLKIDKSHAEQWLQCMQGALNKTEYPENLKAYLFEQLSIPVNMVLKRVELEKANSL